jgi:hypothetical protein
MIDAGRNIVSAAKRCGIQHFVFRSLPDTVKESDGRFKRIHHMNNKYTIEQLARKEIDGFTSLIPGNQSFIISTATKTFFRLLTSLPFAGFFYTNLSWPQYCRLRGMPPSFK